MGGGVVRNLPRKTRLFPNAEFAIRRTHHHGITPSVKEKLEDFLLFLKNDIGKPFLTERILSNFLDICT
jgi:hypothetical protein